MATHQRHGAKKQTNSGVQTHQFRHDDTNEVLSGHKQCKKPNQHNKLFPAPAQSTHTRVDANDREKINQQKISGIQVKLQGHRPEEMEHKGQTCEEQATRHRSRDGQPVKAWNGLVDLFANQQGHDADRDRKKRRYHPGSTQPCTRQKLVPSCDDNLRMDIDSRWRSTASGR